MSVFKFNYYYKINSSIIFIFFLLLFTIKNNFGLTAVLLLGVSLFCFAGNFKKIEFQFDYYSLILIFSSTLLIMNVVLRENLNIDYLKLPFFFLSLVPIYIYLSYTGLSYKVMSAMIGLASIVGGCVGIYQTYALGMTQATGPFWMSSFGALGVIFLFFNMAVFIEYLKNKNYDYAHLAFYIASFIGSISILYTSISRSSIVTVAVLLTLFLFYFRIWKRKKVIIATILLLVGAVSFYNLFPENRLNIRINYAIYSVVNYDVNKPGTSNATVRIDMWRAALQIGIDNPIVGVGLSNHRQAVKSVQLESNLNPFIWRNASHMHSDFFDLFSKFGLIGVTLYAALMITTLLTYWQNKNTLTVTQQVLFLSHIITFIVYGLFDTAIGVTNATALLFIPLTIFLALTRFYRMEQLESKN